MLDRKRLTLIGLLFLAIIAVRFLPGCGDGLKILTNGGNKGIEWSDWSYRRSVTIASTTAQSDYQVNVTLDGTFDYGKTSAGGSDIRFNYNGTSLPYWIEEWNAGTSASIWVKVPSLVNGNTGIYLYYGNAGQSSASNFDNTFTKDSGFSGLVARWHMDEGSGTSLDDSSANSNDGTITNAVWAGADGGKWYNVSTAGFSTGDSVSFDGTGDYVTVPDNASLDVADITIAAWVKTTSTATQFVLSKWDDAGNDRSYAIGLDSGKFYFYTAYDADPIHVEAFGMGAFSTGVWYHFAVTANSTTKRIYVNGSELTPAGSLTSPIRISASDIKIGMRNITTPSYFNGIIDEVSIYNVVLSADEIKALSRRSKYSSTVSAPSVGIEEMVP